MRYERLFGVGPSGIVLTILIWAGFLYLEKWIGIPKIRIGPTFRWILLALFAVDFVVTILWSMVALPPSRRGRELVTTGPFRLVRHPLYSVVIFSGSGTVAIGYRSWTVIFSVILLNLLWSWHVRREEEYLLDKFGEQYREYMRTTGQFFPRFRWPSSSHEQ